MKQTNENKLEREVLDNDTLSKYKRKSLSKQKILVVEDEESYLNSYKFALERQCKEIGFATNEQDGLEAIAENHYDVVITDGAMPKYEGREVGNHGWCSPEDYRGKNIAKAAKEKRAYVIGISGEPEKLDCESIDVLMKKPYDVLELIQILTFQPTREEYENETQTRMSNLVATLEKTVRRYE